MRTQTGDSLRVVGADGKEQLVRRDDVSDMRPSAVSLMPAGLLDGLADGQVRDLMTFLLYEPPSRSAAQLENVLGQHAQAEASTPQPVKRLSIVLVAGKQDHGPGQHDYPAWQRKWMSLLGQAPGVTATDAWECPTEEQWLKSNLSGGSNG